MGLRSIVSQIMPDIFTIAGEAATFTPNGGASVACYIIPYFNVQLQPTGMESLVWETGTVIEACLSEILTEPNRGDVFTYSGVDYTVQTILQNDGVVVRVSVV
ncbi:MAG TPA: hypothetical protein DDY86_02595 [Syntrophaceae bacterium]|nr:hypothetical protein [Syntrophaceae bacterium]